MSIDMQAVRRYANGLKDTLKKTDIDNVSNLSDLAVKIVRDFAEEEEVKDFIEYLIKAEIFSSWEDFLFKFLIADNPTYENNIRARDALVDGGYSLNPVVAMYKHFQNLHLADATLDFITLVNKGKYPVLPSFYAAAYEYPLIRAMVDTTHIDLLEILKSACKAKGIDPNDFLKYFGIQKDASTSTNNASTSTTSTTPAASTTQQASKPQPRFTPSVRNVNALMRKYDTIISAIKFRNPGELRNGFSSIAWKDTLTLTPFRYKQLFTSDIKGKRLVQSKTNVKIDAFFRCLTDPELLLVATPGYNFLTTKQILAQDLNVSETLL